MEKVPTVTILEDSKTYKVTQLRMYAFIRAMGFPMVRSGISVYKLCGNALEKYGVRRVPGIPDSEFCINYLTFNKVPEKYKKKRSEKEPLEQLEKPIVNTAINVTAAPQKIADTRNCNAVLERAFASIEDRKSNSDLLYGFATGFKNLDIITNGLKKGELIIIGGRPSMGKSTFALNIVEYCTIALGKSVLIFSLEMSDKEIIMRMLSCLSYIPLDDIMSGKDLDSQAYARLLSGQELLSRANILIDSSANLTFSEIQCKSREISEKQPIDLIIVDYIQLVDSGSIKETRNEEIAKISRGLKALARELDCAVMALSQVNRSVEARANKRPMMSDLRDSGALEEDADMIMFIYRDEVYYLEDSDDPGTAEIILAKNRNGPIGTIRLTFVSYCPRFSDR